MAETLNEALVHEGFSTARLYLVLVGGAALLVPIVTALVLPF